MTSGFGTGVAAGSASLAVASASYLSAFPPSHSWITPAVCIATTISVSLPSGLLFTLNGARGHVIETGSVREAASRAWNSVVDDASVVDGIGRVLNSSAIVSTLVDDLVKGAGPLGASVRFFAFLFASPLDAALSRIDLEVNKKQSPPVVKLEPVVASVVEGVAVRVIDDATAALLGFTVLLVSAEVGTFLLIDAALPR